MPRAPLPSMLLFAPILLLAACGGPAPVAQAPADNSATDRPGLTSAPVAGEGGGTARAPAMEAAAPSFGYYSQGQSRVEFHDAVWLPAEPGTVSVLLAPTPLSAQERAEVLASTTFPGLPLMSKRVDAYPDRYPFAVVRLRVEGEGDAMRVRGYYLMAFAIHEPNYTDNLNGFPDARHEVELEQAADGTRRLRFSGEDEMAGAVRRWALDVAG